MALPWRVRFPSASAELRICLVFVEGGDVFTMGEWATWRWRRREDGSFEVAAWRDGTSLGVAVVPAGVGPGGNADLNQG